ncbi:MAG: tripartite tricarboxylate transporter TctB family protein [Rhodospirillales bacterium]|nr:tripartite tricarboxylate transporter TctB family protein [Rhodospirillales bacterium]
MTTDRTDLAGGFFVFGLVAFIYFATSEMPSGPAGFPRLIAAGLAICGLILIVRALISKAAAARSKAAVNWRLSGLVAGVWLVLIGLVARMGFLVPGVLFLALLAWLLLGRPKGVRECALIFAYAIGVSAVLWLIFGILLGVESPGRFLF